MVQVPLYLRLEGSPFITFYVGPDKIVFHVHQTLLFNASPVFKAAFSGNFHEASERSMQLAEEDKDSVGRMIQWLYTKKFDLTVPVSGNTSQECFMELAKLYALADKYDIPLLKNDIVDDLFDLQKPPRSIDPPDQNVVKYVYENTTEGSSFRKFMVAWYSYHIDEEWYEWKTTRDELSETSPEFALNLVIALGVRLKYPDQESPFSLPSSTFHESLTNEADKDQA